MVNVLTILVQNNHEPNALHALLLAKRHVYSTELYLTIQGTLIRCVHNPTGVTFTFSTHYEISMHMENFLRF